MILKAGTYKFNDTMVALQSVTTDEWFNGGINKYNYDIYNADNGYKYSNMFSVIINGVYEGRNYVDCILIGDDDDTLFYCFGTEADDYYDTGWETGQNSHIPNDIEVDDTFGTWYISNTNYNEVNATPLATIEYNGQTIAKLNAGETATLSCEGKKMASDVVVKIESGYVKPSGSVTITTNTTTDVTDKSEVITNVPTYISVATEDEALDETTIPIVEGQIIIVEG